MSGQYVDHYEVLGIPPSATVDEIRAAHRRRILAAHPDVAGSQGSAEAAARINVARDVLLDPRARRSFDDERARRRRSARRPSGPAPKHAAPRQSRPASYSASAPQPPEAGRRGQRGEPPRGNQASADAGHETPHTTVSRARSATWTSVLRWGLAIAAVLLALFIIVIGLGAKGFGSFMVWVDGLRSSTPSWFELANVRIGSALVGFGWYILRIAIALFLGVGLVQALLNWSGQGASATPGPGRA